MSFGTFMDSLLFNIRADLGTLSAEVSYILAPITPEFVFERRREKIAEALEAAHHFADMEIVIHIAPGTYKECLVINQEHISFIGTDENETKITYSYGALDIMPEGDKRGTFRTPVAFYIY